MRTRTLVFVALFLGHAAACSTTPAISVTHFSGGDKPPEVAGDAVKMKRGTLESYAGLRGGFYVVRSPEDWRVAWQSGDAPPVPATLDTVHSMLVLAAAEEKETTQIRVQRIVETGSLVHVWVKETKAGEGCEPKKERNAFDAVTTPRIDKPIKFYVETERGESCGAPPLATVQCRVGNAPNWVEKSVAQPGDKVDCMMNAESRGAFAVVDRVLGVAEFPGGSSAKLAYLPGNATRGSFSVDVFGTYSLRGEGTDEAGRKGIGLASVSVLPPKSRDVIVQVVWTNFDANDDPETFPRTKLKALERKGPKSGAKLRECSSEGTHAADTCEIRHQASYTHMTLKASDRKMALSVQYVDERIEKGPLLCINTYFDGAKTAETCDRKHRDADEKWDLGALDMATGRFDWQPDPAAVTDGGVPEGGAPDGGVRDAGVRDGGN